jgi:hypothetical protein
MNLEEYNERGGENDTERGGYAEPEAPERTSEASSLPAGETQGSARPGSAISPETLNSRVLMARSTALAHTGVVDKEAREVEGGHQAILAARAVRLTAYGPGEGDLKNLLPVLAELGMWTTDTTDFCGMGVCQRSKG